MYTIRGKRKRPSASTNNQQVRRSTRGRPMKRKEDLAVPRDVRIAQLRRLQLRAVGAEVPQDVQPSALEKLPNELIQQIFFLCFEVNLPRASLRLAQALSTDATYNALVLFAYFDDDGQSPVDTKHFLPAAYWRLTLEEKTRLQGKILSCRWLTLDRMRGCMPLLCRLVMAQAWHRENADDQWAIDETNSANKNDVNAVTEVPKVTQATSPFADRAILPSLDDTAALTRHFFARASSSGASDGPHNIVQGATLNEDYLPRILTWESDVKPSGIDQSLQWCKGIAFPMSVLAARFIPEWLVQGKPWTEEKIQLLQLLRHGSRFVSPPYTFVEVPYAALFKGMTNAIRERRVTALETLLEIHDGLVECDKQLLRDESAVHTEPTLRQIPIHVFHAATKAEAKSSEIMWLLIRGGLEALPKDDDVLTAWAIRKRAKGDGVAKFLLDHMSDETAYGHLQTEAVFHHGRLNPSANFDPPMPAEHQFDEELGYLSNGYGMVPNSE